MLRLGKKKYCYGQDEDNSCREKSYLLIGFLISMVNVEPKISIIFFKEQGIFVPLRSLV